MMTETCPAYAYELNQCERTLNHGETQISYGITCFQHSAGSCRHVVQSFPDVALRQEMVQSMAALFTLCQLPPDRFQSAVINLLP